MSSEEAMLQGASTTAAVWAGGARPLPHRDVYHGHTARQADHG